MRINVQGLKFNAQHLAGHIVGRIALRPFGLRYGKESRGQHWFSTVAANLAADGCPLSLPFAVLIKG